VLVLDMGDPVKIVDLARDMIKLSGRSVDEIRIVFTGLRPGEKLFEELLADADDTLPTSIAQLRIARLESRETSIAGLLRRAAEPDSLSDEAVRAELMRVVPEYQPAGR